MKFGNVLQKDKYGKPILYYIGFSNNEHLAWNEEKKCIVKIVISLKEKDLTNDNKNLNDFKIFSMMVNMLK